MIVFLHPAGLDGQSAEFLTLDIDAAPTLPRHGRRRESAPLTFAGIVDEIVGWTNGPVDLVGASFGAMIAMQVAVRRAETVRSLVLACTAGRVDRKVHEQRARDTEARGSLGMLDETLQRWFTTETLAQPEHAGVRYAAERLRADRAADLAATWRLIADHDVLDALGAVRVPVTLIVGRHDVATPPAVMAELAARLPQAHTVELDAGHMAFLERPAEFSAAVRGHLAEVNAHRGAA